MNDQVLGVYVGSKIPRILRDGIDKAIERGDYLNRSDFVRDAVKEKLEGGFCKFKIKHKGNSLEA
jgi:metal-responsive CopG/Arc/MetJ family transcriptional regulator